VDGQAVSDGARGHRGDRGSRGRLGRLRGHGRRLLVVVELDDDHPRGNDAQHDPAVRIELQSLPEHVTSTHRTRTRGPGRSAGAAVVLAAAALLLVAGCGGGEARRGLTVPAGTRATAYATGLTHVSAFAFDARGRLWATTSGATDHRADGVWLVAHAGARPVKVISGPKGPLGLTWLRGRLYVASFGRVDVFAGFDGRRFASRREILKEPAGSGWNDNLVATADGRLLMSISASCDHCSPSSKWSGAIVSFRPDGSDVRFYATRVRAGYGLAFVPGTSTLLVSMNQRDDLGAKTPGDWLADVREGEDWGFPGCWGQRGAACKGVPKPIAVLDAHAAAGGVAILPRGLAATKGPVALVSEWARGKVECVALADGGAAATSVTPCIAGLESPLPLAATRDGGVLVGDWATGTVWNVAAG
jgi:glucose/arabinose dehydrogenase